MPMCDQSTACNPHWHIRNRQSTIKRVHRATPGLIQPAQYCLRSTMCNVTLKHTPSQKMGTTDFTAQQFKVCIGSRAPHCRIKLENWQDTTPKASHKKQSIMEYSPGLPKYIKSLRSCSVNRAKMLLNGLLGVKCHSQYNRVIRLHHHCSANSQWGLTGD